MTTVVPGFLPEPRVRRFSQLIAGLVLYGASLALLVTADFGLDPWDVFHQGLSETIDLRLGFAVVLTSFVVLILWIPIRQRPGLGTLMNAVLIGLVFEATIELLPDDASIGVRIALLLIAVGLNAVATGMYVGAGLGPGPRDGLMTGIAARGYAIKVVRTTIEVIVLAVGWLLGGSVGIGTVVYALGIGPLVHRTLPFFAIAKQTD